MRGLYALVHPFPWPFPQVRVADSAIEYYLDRCHTLLDRWSRVRKAVGLNAYSKSGQRKRSLAYARADKVRREDLIGESYKRMARPIIA